MDAELQRLKTQVDLQQKVFDACDPAKLRGHRKTLAETWLAETGLLLERLQRDVVRLNTDKPPAVGMNQAWGRYQQVYTALSPIASTMDFGENVSDEKRAEAAYHGLLSIVDRLLFVLRFLWAQIALAIVLLAYTVWLFSSFNPQTALTGEQLEARKLVRSHVLRIEKIVDR